MKPAKPTRALGHLVLLISLVVLPACQTLAEHGNVTFDLAPDGERIVFASADGDLFLFELATQSVTRLTQTDGIESFPQFSPDGKSVLYSRSPVNDRFSSLFQISIDGSGGVQLTNEAAVYDCAPVLSADGAQIAFARAHLRRPYSMGGWTWDQWDVYVMDADGSNVRRLTNASYRHVDRVAFSPDGQEVYYSAKNPHLRSGLIYDVFAVAVDGSDQPKTSIQRPPASGKFAAWGSEPAFSADGGRLAMISDRAQNYHYDVVVLDRTTDAVTSTGATAVSRYNRWPVFSPDGTKIYLLAGTSRNQQSRAIFSFWSIDLASGTATQIADSGLFTDPTNFAQPLVSNP